MHRLGALLALSLIFQSSWGLVDAPALAASEEEQLVDEQTDNPDALLRLGDLFKRGEGVAADLPKALQFYRRALEAGSRTAKLRVGEMLARGQGTPRDFAAGTTMIREVAAAGDGNAFFLLGELLSEEEPTRVAAIHAYQQAAILGRDDAFLKLGDLTSSGPTADLSEALSYYRQAAATGSQTGKLRVGEMLIRGQGTPVNMAGGLELITDAADSGSVNGLILLGDLHSGEPGSIADDPPKALQYYRRAALAGEPRALLALGDTLSKFDPDHRDGSGAIGAYEQAASRGSIDALLRLGDVFSDGRIVAVDLPGAFAYYQRAAEAGSTSGRLRMAEMLARGHGTRQDVEAGFRLVRQLIDEKESRAHLVLGDLLSRGDAGAIDGDAAVDAYRRAGQAGLAEAFLRLGDLYAEGMVVRRQVRRAAEHYLKAAELGSGYGLYALGVGYLNGDFGSPAEAAVFLDGAAAAGVADVVTVRADELIAAGDASGGIALLEESAASGNLAGDLGLVAIYRDGVGDRGRNSIRKDLDLARRLLSGLESRLDRGAILHETLLLDAATNSSAAYEGIYSRAKELSPRGRESLLRALLTVNANAYTYLVQAQLARLELYSGPKSGLLGGPTIKAITRYCALRAVTQLCRLGPLSGQTARVLAGAF